MGECLNSFSISIIIVIIIVKYDGNIHINVNDFMNIISCCINVLCFMTHYC